MSKVDNFLRCRVVICICVVCYRNKLNLCLSDGTFAGHVDASATRALAEHYQKLQ